MGDNLSLAEALAKAQSEMLNPRFDATNPHFRTRYASLAAVRDATIPLLARFGIAVTQDILADERGLTCITTFHFGAETMRFSPLTIPVAKADAQGIGAAATYARRYSLMAACGVVGDTDNDGEEQRAPEKLPTPAAYAEWQTQFRAIAEKGTPALQEAWRTSSQEIRAFVQSCDAAWFASIKTLAANVKVTT
jgi:ERF superfamily